MKVTIDSDQFYINMGQVMKHIQAWYDSKNANMDDIQLKNGKRIDFGKKSLLRLGTKTLLTGIAIPMLSDMYTDRGLTLPPHEKHADLIDYLVKSILELAAIVEKDVNIYATSTTINDSNVRNVTSISTIPSRRIERPRSSAGTTESEETRSP